jgi:hypothetical protein
MAMRYPMILDIPTSAGESFASAAAPVVRRMALEATTVFPVRKPHENGISENANNPQPHAKRPLQPVRRAAGAGPAWRQLSAGLCTRQARPRRLRQSLAEADLGRTAGGGEMTDIVERLRQDAKANGSDVLCWEELSAIELEAADEIERLRSRLKWFEDAGGVAVTTKVHQQHAENERLREAKKDALWVINQGQIEINRLHEELLSRHNELRAKADEIERLGAWVRELRSALGELRTHLHAAGRRPEECYEMSVIDNALGWRAGDE